MVLLIPANSFAQSYGLGPAFDPSPNLSLTIDKDKQSLHLIVGILDEKKSLLELDYRKHSEATSLSSFMYYFYGGIGGQLRLHKDDKINEHLFMSLPLGVQAESSLLFLQAFAEVVLLMGTIPETKFEIDARIGLRIWFQ